MVSNEYANYIKEVGRSTCLDMHKYKSLRLMNNIFIEGLKSNGSYTTSVTLAVVKTDGKCEGQTYSDYFGSWDNVIVSATIIIRLTDFTASFNLQNGMIYLSSGVRCKYLNTACIDINGGETWDLTSHP